MAKRLRRQAQNAGIYVQHQYVETYKGMTRRATFGRILTQLVEKFKTEKKTFVPKTAMTIRVMDRSVRGVYKRLKREYKEANYGRKITQ